MIWEGKGCGKGGKAMLGIWEGKAIQMVGDKGRGGRIMSSPSPTLPLPYSIIPTLWIVVLGMYDS